MDINDILKLLFLAQCGFAFGISVFVFRIYLSRKDVPRNTRLHILLVAIATLGFLSALTLTVIREKYVWGDVWWWIVGISTIIFDISLFIICMRQIKILKTKKHGTSTTSSKH